MSLIKLGKYVYIHFTTVFLFVLCYYNRNLEVLAVSYISVILHELAHLLAANLIGLKSSHIVLYPFGVNLKLKNRMIYSLTDEIILYMSGPLLNAVLSIFSIFLLKYGILWKMFYWNNLLLFLFNLLPIIPMDGGVILNKIFAYKVGYRLSEKIMKTISVILITAFVLFEIYLIMLSKFNFNLVFICAFLIGNIFISKEKYHIDYTKELMYYKKKNNFKIKKVKCIIIKPDTEYKELVKNFSQGNTYIIFKEGIAGKITEILTEKEIVDEILK